MKSRCDIQPIREWIVNRGCESYKSLQYWERLWFNLEPLTTWWAFDIYTNNWAEYIDDILEALEFLKLVEPKLLLEKMNRLFPGNIPPENLEERYEIILGWNSEKNKLMEEIDEEFRKYTDIIDEAILKYLNLNQYV